MKKAILISVWAICLSNMVFFTDIIINYLIGNDKSSLSGATTEQTQMVLSVVMDAICILLIWMYTTVLTQKPQTN
jgi:hypothetical protein